MSNFQISRMLAILTISTLTFLVPAPALAVDTGIFELDANALDQSAGTDDWESFFVTPSTAHTTRSTGIVSDSSPAVFRNGSKDIDDISAWRYDLGSSPPKDDMLHAYATAYSVDSPTITVSGASDGDLVVYFGADRVSFNGTASLGFWFFKNPVERDDTRKRFINPVTGQLATHANGDTLVAFEYTNGGAITTVKVFEWLNGALIDKGSIGTAATTTPGVYCNTAAGGAPADSICGATNPGGISLPWNGSVNAGQFFEGGINLSKVIGGDACFASFMATSRSSSTSTAALKNFIIHSFPVCSVSVTKTCASPQLLGSSIRYSITGKVLNDGGGALQSLSLSDNPPLDANSLGFFTCDVNGQPTATATASAPLAVGAAVCYRATITSSSNGPSDTITATASTGTGSVSDSAGATCPQLQVNTGMTVTKACDVDLVQQNSQLVLKVNYGGSVCNTSDVALNNVKVCETHGVSIPAGQTPCTVSPRKEFSIGTMAAGACANYQSYGTANYFPADADVGSLTQPEISPVQFRDQVGAVGTPPAILSLPAVSAIPAEAQCGLCPATP